MLKINEMLSKGGNYTIKIEPQVKGADGKYVKNKDYKLELISGEIKELKKKTGEPFEMVDYVCNIINEDGTKTKGIYEVSKTNTKGELNNVIKQMIELDLNKGDIFFLGTNEAGFINIALLGESVPTIEEEPPVDDEEQIDIKDIPF